MIRAPPSRRRCTLMPWIAYVSPIARSSPRLVNGSMGVRLCSVVKSASASTVLRSGAVPSFWSPASGSSRAIPTSTDVSRVVDREIPVDAGDPVNSQWQDQPEDTLRNWVRRHGFTVMVSPSWRHAHAASRSVATQVPLRGATRWYVVRRVKYKAE